MNSFAGILPSSLTREEEQEKSEVLHAPSQNFDEFVVQQIPISTTCLSTYAYAVDIFQGEHYSSQG